MQAALVIPVDLPDGSGRFLTGDEVAEVARHAEAWGFGAVGFTDHPCPPASWLHGGGHHTHDPLTALAYVAAATTRVRLLTSVLVATYRHPLLVAKSVATLDHLSGGRVILGVAAGYLEPEFEILGVDFAGRNDALDDALETMRRTWTAATSTSSGTPGTVGHVLAPPPRQHPHPPIWVGGNSRRAIRRAVEHGDGWMPFPVSGRARDITRTAAISGLPELVERIAYAEDQIAASGRSRPLDVCLVPFEEADDPDQLHRLTDALPDLDELGVTWLSLTLRARDVDELCSRIRASASTLGLPRSAVG